MFTRFNDNTIETKFIQELVRSTNIPTSQIWKPGMFVIRGKSYLTRHGIYRANATGDFPSLQYKDTIYTGNKKDGYTEQPNSDVFTWVDNYFFGDRVDGYTSKYTGQSTMYDAKIHQYLGDYLRAYRDIFDIDLMPLYNCFAGEYVMNLDFSSNGKVVSKQADGYNVAKVPVKFNTPYYISIDSNTPIEMICAIYGNKGNIESYTDVLNGLVSIDDEINSTYDVQTKTSFRKPFLYKTPQWEQQINQYWNILSTPIDDIGQYERFLNLFIKIPRGNKSSIVVIEGNPNLTPSSMKHPSNVDGVPSIQRTIQYDKQEDESANIDYDIQRELSLIQMSDNVNYAFSNRLLEYLTKNVIDSTDDIGQNIQSVQKYITNPAIVKYNGSERRFSNAPTLRAFSYPYTKGAWNNNMQEYLYELAMGSTLLPVRYDIDGFVDKDTEYLITRGQQ